MDYPSALGSDLFEKVVDVSVLTKSFVIMQCRLLILFRIATLHFRYCGICHHSNQYQPKTQLALTAKIKYQRSIHCDAVLGAG